MPQVLNYENFKLRYEEIEKRRMRRFLFTDTEETFTVTEHPVIYFAGETTKSGYTVKRGSMVEIPVQSKTRTEVKYILTNERILAEIYAVAKGDLVGQTFHIVVDENGGVVVEVVPQENVNKETSSSTPEQKSSSGWLEEARNLIIALNLIREEDIPSIANVLMARGWASDRDDAMEKARELLIANNLISSQK
ncbi:MAG: hypothetical protein DRN49_00100 [Thaumarchaeota archaeon]|nr:MAG: hypothetical protein DRN49_00100 [Nitrososphaerota archaeon]